MEIKKRSVFIIGGAPSESGQEYMDAEISMRNIGFSSVYNPLYIFKRGEKDLNSVLKQIFTKMLSADALFVLYKSEESYICSECIKLAHLVGIEVFFQEYGIE